MACICVVGMHRSGTSCLTGIMQRTGIELGEVFTENQFNKKGNRENARIVTLNDALLNLNGGAWNNPVEVTKWTSEQAAERDSIIADIKALANGGDWGFKDPRSMFALDFWLEGIDDIKFIGTFRHPARVALSLKTRADSIQTRDGGDMNENLLLWNSYNQKMLDMLGKEHFDIVDFDDDPDIYLEDVIDKLIKLGIDDDKAQTARAFFDQSLRNQSGTAVDDIALPEQIVTTYQQLKSYKNLK